MKMIDINSYVSLLEGQNEAWRRLSYDPNIIL